MTKTIVDSSSLINLYAAGDPSIIVPALELELYVPPAVEKESNYLRRREGDELQLVPIDFRESVSLGLIQISALEGEREFEFYVQFAASLDDGEAMCLALALSRHWLLAADDRKALRIAKENEIPTVTTPELMRRWAANSKASPETVSAALKEIENAARFVPPRDSPHFEWWSSHVGRAGA